MLLIYSASGIDANLGCEAVQAAAIWWIMTVECIRMQVCVRARTMHPHPSDPAALPAADPGSRMQRGAGPPALHDNGSSQSMRMSAWLYITTTEITSAKKVKSLS